MPPARPPHYARVRALLGALDAPVVQLWGWPGTAKRAILRGLLEDEPEAVYLPAAWLAAPERLEERLGRKVGRRPALLVGEDRDGPWRIAADPAGLATVAALLGPGQRLLVAAERRLALGDGSVATPPDQLLLRCDEIRVLWRAACGRELTRASSERLRDHSDGWPLLLELWARDPAIASGPFDDDERPPLTPIAGLLRERVMAALTADEEEVLCALAERGPAGVPWQLFVAAGDRRRRESTLRSLIDRWALPIVESGHLRLPAALAALLATERATVLAASAPNGESAGSPPAIAASGLVHELRREERSDAVDVRIGLLGVPRVERRDTSGRLVPVSWSFKRPLRILAYLASAPDLQASREEIVSILWPDASEDTVRRNLHPAVSWLRRSVWPGNGPGGVVLLRDGVYSLDPSLRWEVDVRSFFERIEEGGRHLARGPMEEAVASWEAAWRLYQGPFLQGWSDRWVLAQRDELQLRFTDLLRRLGDLKARLGQLTDAEDAYRTLLLEDPLEEGVHVSIMRIYAARGRRDLVNRQYQRLRSVLLQELGVEPSPPTLDAFNELMMAQVPGSYR
jgi:DNA-binding SARP family transcriptional activator